MTHVLYTALNEIRIVPLVTGGEYCMPRGVKDTGVVCTLVPYKQQASERCALSPHICLLPVKCLQST